MDKHQRSISMDMETFLHESFSDTAKWISSMVDNLLVMYSVSDFLEKENIYQFIKELKKEIGYSYGKILDDGTLYEIVEFYVEEHKKELKEENNV